MRWIKTAHVHTRQHNNSLFQRKEDRTITRKDCHISLCAYVHNIHFTVFCYRDETMQYAQQETKKAGTRTKGNAVNGKQPATIGRALAWKGNENVSAFWSYCGQTASFPTKSEQSILMSHSRRVKFRWFGRTLTLNRNFAVSGNKCSNLLETSLSNRLEKQLKKMKMQ